MEINFTEPVATVLYDGTRHGVKWHQLANQGVVLFAVNLHSNSFENWRESYCKHSLMNEAGMKAAYLAGYHAAMNKA